MKKLIETAGNTGIILFILLNLANQFLGLEGLAYTVPLYLSILMLLPMAVRVLSRIHKSEPLRALPRLVSVSSRLRSATRSSAI